jgi:hypothetical protein
MKKILPRVLLNREGDSALCLKASGSNSFAGWYRATKADDHWATRQAQLTAGRARFHRALCGQSRIKNSFHLVPELYRAQRTSSDVFIAESGEYRGRIQVADVSGRRPGAPSNPFNRWAFEPCY